MDRASKFNFAAPVSRSPNRGYLGWLQDLDRIGQRGGAYVGGCLRLGPQAGDGRFICVRCGALQLICYGGWIDPIKVPVKQEVHE